MYICMLSIECCDSSHGELFCWSQWDSSQYVQLKLQSEGFEIFAMINICLFTGHHTRFFHSFPGTASLCSTSGPKGLVHSTGGHPSSLDHVQFQIISDVCVFRLAPAAGSQTARSHQWSFCFLRACFSSTARSSCCEMLHFSPRSQQEACP